MARSMLLTLVALACGPAGPVPGREPPRPVTLNIADEDKDVAELVKAKGWRLGKGYNLFASGQLIFLDVADNTKPGGRVKLSADEWKTLAKSKVIQSLAFHYVDADDAALKAVSEMAALEIITLDGDAITDAGLKHLAKAPRLWVLRLFAKNVTDEGVAALAAMPNLQVLYLSGEKFTGKAFAAFTNTKLERLELWNQQFGDADAKLLAETGPKLGLLQLLGTKVTATGIRAIAERHTPQYLGFSSRLIDDDLLKVLVEKGWFHRPAKEQVSWLPRLPTTAEGVTTINLSGAAVTDAGLAALAAFKNLESLDLRETKITDAGLVGVPAAFQRLKRVQVGGTRVTLKGVQALFAVESLTAIDLSGFALDEQTFQALGKKKRLGELSLDGAKFQTEWLQHLETARDLRTLRVDNTGFDDAAAKQVVKIAPNLESLHANRTKFGDEGLKALDGLPKLRTLFNFDTAVTKKGVAEFKKANPKCWVTFAGRD